MSYFSDTLKKLQRKLARQQKRSNSWYKTKSLIRKQYTHLNNKKNDFANKIVHTLLTENKIIVMQDEQIAKWKTGMMAEKVQHSVLGRIKSKLMQSNRVVVLDKLYPTTKYCSNCRSKYDITLDECTYVCPTCGYKEDRDIHAAKNMVYFYQQYKDAVGTTDTSKPVKLKFDKNLLRSRNNKVFSFVVVHKLEKTKEGNAVVWIPRDDQGGAMHVEVLEDYDELYDLLVSKSELVKRRIGEKQQ